MVKIEITWYIYGEKIFSVPQGAYFSNVFTYKSECYHFSL